MPSTDDNQTSLPIPVTRYRPVVRCADCDVPLTDSVSRRWGRGPDCRAALHSAPDPGRFAAEQETFPDAEEP
ncbi:MULTISPECIES: DUF6011 domain-containing protein [unclassified Streptomyces]|uniref:DUF6011 domain-containing protein n=1 Tax=unclassified Streptomyces TaxID=2593676 RepID=UPI00342E542F